MVTNAAGEAPESPTTPTMVVDVDPASVVVLGCVAALAAATWGIVTVAPDMVTRLAVGLVVGIALAPLVSAVERKAHIRRGKAAAIVGGGVVLFFAAVLLLVAPPAVAQASRFSGELPATVEELYSWPVLGARLERQDAAGEVAELIDELPTRLDDQTLAELGERLLGGVVSTIIVAITALAVLIDGERTMRRLRALVPPTRKAHASEVGQVVYQSFGSYFAGSLLVAVLNGLVVLSLGLALGVPLAPIAGLWSMLTNFIPQIGGFLGGSFFVLLALTDSPLTAVIAGVVFLAYQQFENNLLQPAVVGSAVNLTPPVTMLAALVGGAAAGVPGALVATPLIGAAKAVYLVRRGELPLRREPALTRRIKKRLDKLRDQVASLAE